MNAGNNCQILIHIKNHFLARIVSLALFIKDWGTLYHKKQTENKDVQKGLPRYNFIRQCKLQIKFALSTLIINNYTIKTKKLKYSSLCTILLSFPPSLPLLSPPTTSLSIWCCTSGEKEKQKKKKKTCSRSYHLRFEKVVLEILFQKLFSEFILYVWKTCYKNYYLRFEEFVFENFILKNLFKKIRFRKSFSKCIAYVLQILFYKFHCKMYFMCSEKFISKSLF